MSDNDYQAPMADGTDHPLKHVPREVLLAARHTVSAAAQVGDVDADMAIPLADAVVMQLAMSGHLAYQYKELVKGMIANDEPCQGVACRLTMMGHLIVPLRDELVQLVRDLDETDGVIPPPRDRMEDLL